MTASGDNTSRSNENKSARAMPDRLEGGGTFEHGKMSATVSKPLNLDAYGSNNDL